MRPSAWFLPAVCSALAFVCGAATRPRYGGALRAEIRAAPDSFDPSAADAGPLAALVFEPLVRVDSSGAPQPCLALSWRHDAASRRWLFNLRPGVKFHNGFGLVPAAVVASLQAALPGWAVSPSGDAAVSIRASHPAPDLPLELAQTGLVCAHDAEGGLVGTGPFHMVSWEAGRRAVLAANDAYWGGRPFLDSIEITLGRSLQAQMVDLELGKTDIAEIAPAEVRRAADRGRSVWSTAPVNLVAMVFPAGRAEDQRLREALALSIDRASMINVLVQKQGEASAALLPQWLSGYAFAFPAARDLAKAKALAESLPASARNLTLAYESAVPGARALAERIAVNARDAGITIQVAPQNAQADVRLVVKRIASLDASSALSKLASGLALESAAGNSTPQSLFEAERRLLEGYAVIPLFHLPELYGVAGRVRVYQPPAITRFGDWRFEELWLAGTAP